MKGLNLKRLSHRLDLPGIELSFTAVALKRSPYFSTCVHLPLPQPTSGLLGRGVN
jgi:hypothetical protein